MKPASNNQIALLRKLGQKKYREKEGLFVVEGERAVQQVLENRIIKVEAVFIDDDEKFQDIFSSAFLLDKNILDEVSDTENPQGIIAICESPEELRIDELQEEKGLIIACDRIQDPGNLGTIIRTAAWFGAKAFLLGKGSVDLYKPKVVRSTAGATGSLGVISGELNQNLELLEKTGWKTFLLDGNKGAISLETVKFPEKTILVVGNEANGIAGNLITSSRTRIQIPTPQKELVVESLNAAMALGIVISKVVLK